MYIWTSQTAPASWTNEHETHESIMGMKEVHLQQNNEQWKPMDTHQFYNTRLVQKPPQMLGLYFHHTTHVDFTNHKFQQNAHENPQNRHENPIRPPSSAVRTVWAKSRSGLGNL